MWPALVAAILTQAPSAALDQGRALAEELRFAEAVEALELARKEPLPTTEKVEALTLLAKCLVAQGLRPRAEQIYTELLSLSPSVRLPADTSPKLQEVFDAVRARLYPPGYFALEALPGAPGALRVRVVDPHGLLRRLDLISRADASAPWRRRALTVEGDVAQEALGASGATQWYVEALGDETYVLASIASADAPRQLLTDAASAPPKRPPTTADRLGRVGGWVAAGLGATALALALAFGVHGAALASAAKDSSRPPGDWADTARLANTSAADFSSAALVCLFGGLTAGALATVIFAW